MNELEYTYEEYLRDLAEEAKLDALLDSEEEVGYTYEEYLQDLAEEAKLDALLGSEEELGYTYEEYLPEPLPGDEDYYDPSAAHASYNQSRARELKFSKGTHIIFWLDPDDTDAPSLTYLEIIDGVAHIVIEE